MPDAAEDPHVDAPGVDPLGAALMHREDRCRMGLRHPSGVRVLGWDSEPGVTLRLPRATFRNPSGVVGYASLEVVVSHTRR